MNMQALYSINPAPVLSSFDAPMHALTPDYDANDYQVEELELEVLTLDDMQREFIRL